MTGCWIALGYVLVSPTSRLPCVGPVKLTERPAFSTGVKADANQAAYLAK